MLLLVVVILLMEYLFVCILVRVFWYINLNFLLLKFFRFTVCLMAMLSFKLDSKFNV